jgi:hypothetical protein
MANDRPPPPALPEQYLSVNAEKVWHHLCRYGFLNLEAEVPWDLKLSYKKMNTAAYELCVADLAEHDDASVDAVVIPIWAPGIPMFVRARRC